MRRQRKDGSTIDVLLSTTALKDGEGAVVGAAAFILDITERRQAELQLVDALAAADLERRRLMAVLEALTGAIPASVVVNREITERREAEREREQMLASLQFERNRLSSLFQQVPAFIVVLRGPHHVFDLANDAYYQVVGFRELIGKPALEALPELAGQGFAGVLDHVLDTGEPFTANQMRVMLQRTPDGPLEERFVSFVYQAIDEADGTRSGVLAHGVDVTEQVRATERLRQSEQRYRTVVNLAPDGIVVHRDGQVVFANVAAARTAGMERPEDLEGRLIVDFIHPDSLTQVEDRVRAMEAGQQPPTVVQYWRRRDGTAIPMEVTSLPIEFDGRPAIQTVFRDITERRQLEEQLRASQKMESIGRLAGGVAHDFNNILTVIRGYAGIARTSLPITHPIQPDLFEIEQGVDRAAALTRQLLAFGRRQTLRSDFVDIALVLGEMENMLRRLLGEHNELVIRIGDGVHGVTADRSQVEQVITNLVVNARDAMPDGGTILVHVEDSQLSESFAARHPGAIPGRYALLVVEDNGCGMTPEIRDQVFEPFFTTKPVGQGTGLGLSTVDGIVKQSNGYIHIASTPGRGTRVQVWIPVAVNVAVSTQNTDAPADAGPVDDKKTVLIAEDSTAVRSVIRRSLEAAGYWVIETNDGRQALDVLTRQGSDVDLLITDLAMPRMGGRRLIASLRELGHRPAIVVMTGHGEGLGSAQDELSPDAVFIDKPFTTSALIAAVRRAFEARRATDDAVVSAMHQDRA